MGKWSSVLKWISAPIAHPQRTLTGMYLTFEKGPGLHLKRGPPGWGCKYN